MQANLNWLTDPEVFRVNRLDAHSDHLCYATEQEMEQGNLLAIPVAGRMLEICLETNPSLRPEGFWQEEYDDSCFGRIQVPGHIEMQGYGQIQYINTLYPWDGRAELRPPEIDWDHTSVGSYVRTFDLEPGLLGKSVCICFQGVERAFYVWLNGQFVGYAEDSFTPSEFDLTPYLQERDNRLCVEVYQHSSASWLEDQDFFRFSGIFRSVVLYAKPQTHVEDLWIRTGLQEDNTTGTFRLRLLVSGPVGEIWCKISHPRQGCLFDGRLSLTPEGKYLVSQALEFEDILPWSYESPELYRVVLTVLDEQGCAAEWIPYRTGFRRFEKKNGLMLLNGQRLVIRGVNRHEWNPETGRAIGLSDMEKAMETIRKNNINAVRTSHYPNQTPWYHLCDENGIYLMDEANLESHGSWQKLGAVEPSWNVPGSLPQWRAAVLDRAESMFQRDKNHVSILFWSCGNESYAGEDILAMADWFRAQDPSRLVHYEGVFHNRAFDAISDVESRMYASPSEIRRYLESHPEKPFLLCEYMHDMGNSLGGMESYIRLEEEFPQYQGGFIWDYMDQALWHKDASGNRILGYGGDFGDRQSDYAFSGNGIVFADGREKPAMQEVRYWYAPKDVRAQWDAENGKRAGAVQPIPRKPGKLKTVHGDGALGVFGENFELLFSYPEGGPVSLVSGGKQWLWRAPRPAYWRAPTENDLGNGFAVNSSLWAAVDGWQVCSGIRLLEDTKDRVSICYTYTAPAMPGLVTEVTYTVAKGCLETEVCYHGAPGRPQLPLLGLRFATPEPVEEVRWLGLSGETYPDRKKGGRFGWHQETPEIPDYLRPQECGCHVDTHQTVFRNGAHRIVLEKVDRPYAFSAIAYTPQQLSQAYHKPELPQPCRTVVTVCGAMRGVGGIDSWGADVEQTYQISSQEDIRFSFRVHL